MILQLLSIIFLASPIIVEVYDDRDGEDHPSKDWIYRTLLVVVVSATVALINPLLGFWVDFLRCAVLSGGMFIALFPYIMNVVLYRRKVIQNPKWWDHLSSSAIPDKWPQWAGLPWTHRMGILLWFLSVSIAVYACPCKIADVSNPCMICKI